MQSAVVTLPGAFREVLTTISGGFGRDQFRKALVRFVGALDAATEQECAEWLDVLRANPATVCILCGLLADGSPEWPSKEPLPTVLFEKLTRNQIDRSELGAVIDAALGAEAFTAAKASDDRRPVVIVLSIDPESPVTLCVRVHSNALNGTMLWKDIPITHSHPVALALEIWAATGNARLDLIGNGKAGTAQSAAMTRDRRWAAAMNVV